MLLPRIKLSLLSLVVLSLTILSGCNSSEDNGQTIFENYEYRIPAQKNDGWHVTSFSEYNIEPVNFENLVNSIRQNHNGYRHIDSLAIAYHGKLIFDERLRESLDFADDWANNRNVDLHVVNSVTKSFTSALIGIAIEQGYIEDVNVKVHDYFQHKLPIANWSDEKANISLQDWLTMRHGYDWNEWDISYLEPENLNSQMNASDDPVQFLLDRPMETQPSSTFSYSTGVSFGLGRLLQRATGVQVHRYLERELLNPLQITKFDFWKLDNQLHTGSALYLETRDMAKLGQLYLNGGVWNGQQIISHEWIKDSTLQRIDLNASGSGGYGYHWWMTRYQVGESSFASYYADGFGGQFIFVIPELELVIAMTGSAYEYEQSKERNIRQILEREILPNFVTS